MHFISNIVDSIYNIFWESFFKPRFMVLLAILVVSWAYLFLSTKVDKFCQNIEKELSYKYDNIFYLWSVFYHKHLDKLSSNPWLIVLKSIRWSLKSKYVSNRKAIKKTIKKIENKLWTTVISDEERKSLSKLHINYSFRKLLSILVKWIFALIAIFLLIIFICVLMR